MRGSNEPVYNVRGYASARRLLDAGWSSPVARQAHNLKVTGSNPVPATKPIASQRSPFAGQMIPRIICCGSPRQAHNLKVTGSNPVPATKQHITPLAKPIGLRGFLFWRELVSGNGMRSKSGNCRNASKRSQNRIALTIWPLASCSLRLGRGELPAEIIVSAMADQ